MAIDLRAGRLEQSVTTQKELKDAASAAKKALDDAARAKGKANSQLNSTNSLTRMQDIKKFEEANKAYELAKSAYNTSNTSYKDFNKSEYGSDFIKTTDAAIRSSNRFTEDLGAAQEQVDSSGLDLRLSKIRDDASVTAARDAYAKATDLSLVRDTATAGLQAAESSSNRQLAARLAQSGVKGGLAGGAFTDVANMNLRNRAALESNLAQQNVAANQQRAQFETQLAQFDLGQTDAEKNLRNTAVLGFATKSQMERSGIKQDEIAKNMGTMSGGK